MWETFISPETRSRFRPCPLRPMRVKLVSFKLALFLVKPKTSKRVTNPWPCRKCDRVCKRGFFLSSVHATPHISMSSIHSSVGPSVRRSVGPSVRRSVGPSVSTSRKVGKRAFPPLPTRPRLVLAVYPALFFSISKPLDLPLKKNSIIYIPEHSTRNWKHRSRAVRRTCFFFLFFFCCATSTLFNCLHADKLLAIRYKIERQGHRTKVTGQYNLLVH